MSNLKKLALVTMITLIGSSAWAIKDPETGLNFADTSRCSGAAAKAAGVGVREATMGIDVYGVVVYINASVAGKSMRSASGCVKMLARFVRNVGADKIRAAWLKGFKKNGLSAGDATVKKFLSVITTEIKKRRYMVMEMKGSNVYFKYMGKGVSISGAGKLARAIKNIYLGGNSSTPALVKDVRKRGIAKP